MTLFAFAPAAKAYIYWADTQDNSIARATLAGTDLSYSFIQGANGPAGLAVDGSFVYWAAQGTGSIGRANLDGSGVNPSFIPNVAGTPTSVAVGGGCIFWVDASAAHETIGRANLDGTGAIDNFISYQVMGSSSPPQPYGVATDGHYVYWTDSARYVDTSGNRYYIIGRANIDGSGIQELVVIPYPGSSAPRGIAVDSQHVYWSSWGEILGASPAVGEANLDGSAVNTSLVVARQPCNSSMSSVAVDAAYVYWNDCGSLPLPNTLGRASLNGTGVDHAFIADAHTVSGLAVDALTPPVPPVPPVPPPLTPGDEVVTLKLVPRTLHTGKPMTFVVTLKAAAKITLQLLRYVPASDHGKHRRRAQYVSVGTLSFGGKSGANKLRVSKVRGHWLIVGRYKAKVSAGGRPHLITFKIRP